MNFFFILIFIFQLSFAHEKNTTLLENIVQQIDQKNFKVFFEYLNLPSVKAKNFTDNEKIINGQPALPGAFPLMISLGMFSSSSYRHRCGGTIVKRKYVVTAAHCVTDVGQSYDPASYFKQNNKVLTIIAGTQEISSINFLDLFKNKNIYLVRKIAINPDYMDSINANDIAVLLIESIDFSPTVFSVDFPSSVDPSKIFGQVVTTNGWGLNELGVISNKLMTTTLTVLNGTPLQASCEGFENDFYCVKDLSQTNSNVCFGDSGGPLLNFEQNKWTLYGITSFVFVDSSGNCLNTAPSFFVMVPRLSQWLNAQILN